jgi:hypothetical protein
VTAVPVNGNPASPATRLTLRGIISNGAGVIEGFLFIALFQNGFCPLGMTVPAPGKTIGLQSLTSPLLL